MNAEQVRQLRAVGCAIGGAALLFLAHAQYGDYAARGEHAALLWCAALVVGALGAFAGAVYLRSRR
ncbi:hypothetical protein [Variovorax sp. PAMC 28711]|uniref:hypothetical protein n=1 Tax=Variovorax sp. PAMC 28711 TaxID=1795631 RepID=UPI00078B37D1|nr:hypothetical protein [Variovorax sp. PAMC 28711]AMM24271.1 hypothetical protein AX767_07855 [Variovorax sp. PAMC 28711]